LPVTALILPVAIFTAKGYPLYLHEFLPRKFIHSASDWYIGSMTPPCTNHFSGTLRAKSSTCRSGNLPNPGGSGYSLSSSGMRRVRWNSTLSTASR
jgi:hypothetical protein